MIVYRIARKKYARDISGLGAKKVGGRWNFPGMALLYTSGSISLAMLEVAVHLPLEKIPSGFYLIKIKVPDSHLIVKPDMNKLPLNWALSVHAPYSQKLGDDFVNDGKYLVLKVPSAVVPDEFNYLINPEHEDFGKVKILEVKELNFDKRLFKDEN